MIGEDLIPKKFLLDILKHRCNIIANPQTGKTNLSKIILSEFAKSQLPVQIKIFDTCFDKKTEILTKNGWKLFKNLTDKEVVATLNTNNELEYQQITRKIKQKASKIFVYNGVNLNFAVSSGHEFIINQRFHGWLKDKGKKGDIIKRKILTIEELMNAPNRNWIPQSTKWIKKEILEFRIGKYKFQMDAWLKFFGLWIADGTVSMKTVSIDQHQKREKILDGIFNEIGIPYKKYYYIGSVYKSPMVKFAIHSTILAKYFNQFGKAKDKYIPREFLEFSSRQLQILLEGLMLGDGSRNGRQYNSYSEKLLDNIQELILKIGKVGNKVFNKHSKYVIIRKHNHVVFNKKNVKIIEDYNNYVYDVTVPNHTIYVRRNGKPMWSRNCGVWRYNFLSNFKFQEVNNSTRKIYDGMDNILFDVEFNDSERIMQFIGNDVLLNYELNRERKKAIGGKVNDWKLYCIEEAQSSLGRYALSRETGRIWLKMISEGANFGLGFLFIGQRAADISASIIERSTCYFIGKTTGDNNIRKLRGIVGKSAGKNKLDMPIHEKAKTLNVGEFIWWSGKEAWLFDCPLFEDLYPNQAPQLVVPPRSRWLKIF